MRLVLGVVAEEHVTDSVAESLRAYPDARQRSTACRDLRLIPVWRSPA